MRVPSQVALVGGQPPRERALSLACALLLLGVFVASLPFSLGSDPERSLRHVDRDASTAEWPFWLAVVVLIGASVGAAAVSDWFVTALEPAIGALHISQAFAGIVVVAIAGNAVENVVGIRLASKNRPDYAMSVILNSSLLIALVVALLLDAPLGFPEPASAWAALRRWPCSRWRGAREFTR